MLDFSEGDGECEDVTDGDSFGGSEVGGAAVVVVWGWGATLDDGTVVERVNCCAK